MDLPPAWASACQFFICTFATLALVSIWRSGQPWRIRSGIAQPAGRKVIASRHHYQNEPTRDPAVKWVAWAFAVWAVLGLILWVWRDSREASRWNGAVVDFRSIASIVNSVFFLLAIGYFDYGPTRLKFVDAHVRWRYIVIGAGGIATLVAYSLGGFKKLDPLPKVLLSNIALGFIVVSLFRSFIWRGFLLMAWLVVGAVLLTVWAQLFEVPYFVTLHGDHASELRGVALVTSKAALVILFLTLAFSWAHEESALLVEVERIRVFFVAGRKIEILMPGANQRIPVELTERLFERLHQFARARCAKEGDGWLNLKDHGLDHPDLNKIAKAVGIYPRTLFENHFHENGWYRLRVPPHNIDLGPVE